MAHLNALRDRLLSDGKITRSEVDVIRETIEQDGRLDLQDVQVLVELLSEANDVCPEFDELFFPALKDVILQDGCIGRDEQFYLLKMLYSDGNLRENEKSFLAELKREAREYPPEFESLCQTAFEAPQQNWDLGGTRRASH